MLLVRRVVPSTGLIPSERGNSDTEYPNTSPKLFGPKNKLCNGKRLISDFIVHFVYLPLIGTWSLEGKLGK